jgi:DNA-binding IclR family transcriptional regulator
VIAGLGRVRKQGFATVAEENIRGVLSVGAPIRDRDGKVLAALSVAFPKYLDAAVTLQSITPHVVAAVQRISRAVGGTPT